MRIVENLGKIRRLTGEGRKRMHEASKFEDVKLFLFSFLRGRKIERVFFTNPNPKVNGDQSYLLALVAQLVKNPPAMLESGV